MFKNEYLGIYFWVGLIISWITYIDFLLWSIGMLILALALILLLIKKRPSGWLLLFLSPFFIVPSYSILFGIIGYFSGNAYLKGVGLPGPEFRNLEREYRLHRSSSGCMITGLEPLTQVPNNFVVKGMTTLFGFQNGVYSGKYPTRQEAFEHFDKQAEEVTITAHQDNIAFEYQGTPFLLATNQFHKAFPGEQPATGKPNTMQVAEFYQDCLIIGKIPNQKTGSIYLHDRENRVVFAMYLHR